MTALVGASLGVVAGCGDDDGGSGGGRGNQVARACTQMLTCIQEQYDAAGLDLELDEDTLCESYYAWGRVLGGNRACENAIADYFDCIADTSCAAFAEGAVCEGAAERASSACN